MKEPERRKPRQMIDSRIMAARLDHAAGFVKSLRSRGAGPKDCRRA
jgi:hypothetical protein